MFNNKSCFLRVQNESFDDSRSDDSLFGIEVGRRLINQIHIRSLSKSKNKSDSLQLTPLQTELK